jgi:SAM-dependent MidA family methyltransferase
VTLRDVILQGIRENGPIPFSRYMELCLYHPEFGYYSRSADQFGKAGDFYTSSDVHAVFGRLLSRQFEEIWRAFGAPGRIEVIELGPGRGLFAQDVLDWSEKKFPEFFRAIHYALAERSPALRQRLRLTLERRFKSGKASLFNIPSFAGEAEGDAVFVSSHVPVIFFANEFFDALPVEILSTQGALRICERKGQLVESWIPASAQELAFLDRYSVHPEPGERIEVPLAAQHAMREVGALITQGLLIAIDYGYTRQEQLAGRNRGTLAAFRQHSETSNPYEAPGEQDITAHVNFTALADAVAQPGMTMQPLVTQSQFLLGVGQKNQFADAFEDCRLPQERAKVALQLKHLITPEGMGETFKVLLASKGIDEPRTVKLSGLSFGR